MCECMVGPGKFEGEGALTALAYSSMLSGGSDLTEYEPDETTVEFFKAPFNFDADEENVSFAREQGLCDDCIREALDDESFGLALWEDSQGFVYVQTFDDESEWNDAIALYGED